MAVLPVVVLLAAGIGALVWQFNRPPFDLARLQRLRQGMTQAQVRDVLGKPGTTDATSWHYSRPMAWPIVHVNFDAEGRLASYEYDY